MMNAYLSRQEKPNFVRLVVVLGLAADILGEYGKSKAPDKDFMRELKTGLTWMKKAINRRKEFLDVDAAKDFAKQCERLEPIIFVPSDKARKEFAALKELVGTMVISKDDFEDWYSKVIPFTCGKCDGTEREKCGIRVILTKYGVYPVDPDKVDGCQYSYLDEEEEKQC